MIILGKDERLKFETDKEQYSKEVQRIYDEAKIEAFSKLPGKKQLISMIMSAINGPVQKIAATLQAYVEKMEAGEKS